MSQKKPSPKFYKIISNIWLALCGVCLFIGIPTFAFGGVAFVIFGVICFVASRHYKKIYNRLTPTAPIVEPQSVKPQIETPQPLASEPKVEIAPILDAPQKPSKPIAIAPIGKTKTYKVTGMSNYIDNIMSLAVENIDYDKSKKELIEDDLVNERIYQYDFYPCKIELVPEPNNPYDSNAIKVIVEKMHVGYIKAGSCSHVLKLLREDRIIKIDCEMRGGKYKYLGYDEDEDTYYLDKDDTPWFVHLSITEK